MFSKASNTFTLFFLLALTVCHPCTHANAVSIMTGCCLYSDPIFPDRRGAICFVCHTKRGNAMWVQVDHPSTHTHIHTRARQAPLSWCSPIDFLCQHKLWLTVDRHKPLYLLDKSSVACWKCHSAYAEVILCFQRLESAALFLISLLVIWTKKEGKLKRKEGIN